MDSDSLSDNMTNRIIPTTTTTTKRYHKHTIFQIIATKIDYTYQSYLWLQLSLCFKYSALCSHLSHDHVWLWVVEHRHSIVWKRKKSTKHIMNSILLNTIHIALCRCHRCRRRRWLFFFPFVSRSARLLSLFNSLTWSLITDISVSFQHVNLNSFPSHSHVCSTINTLHIVDQRSYWKLLLFFSVLFFLPFFL